MTSLIQYVSRILIISLPAVIVFLCFMPYRMRALKAMNLHSGWQREIGLILFVVSIFRYLGSDIMAYIYLGKILLVFGEISAF